MLVCLLEVVHDVLSAFHGIDGSISTREDHRWHQERATGLALLRLGFDQVDAHLIHLVIAIQDDLLLAI